MARFGLTEDSDEEFIPIQTTSKATLNQVNRGSAPFSKGKARAARLPVPEDDLDDRNEETRKTWAAGTNAENDAGKDFTKNVKLSSRAFDDEDAPKFSREGQFKHGTSNRGEPKQPVRAVSGETTEDELDYDYNYHEDDYDEEEGAFQRRRTSAPPPSWPEQLGLEPHRVHVMQASLFRAPEEKEREKTVRTDIQSNKLAAKKAKLGASRTALSGLEPREHMEKLFSASSKLLRKHSRSSEGDGLRPERSERTTFDQSLDPEPYRPTRKVVRMQDTKSLMTGVEGAYVDAGLAFGRSFRVSWGPGGMLARVSGFSGSTVHVQCITTVADDEETERIRASRLLETQINHSTIETTDEDIPIAFPARTLTFSTFSSLLPENENSHEAQIWRQGVALFDPIGPTLTSISFSTKQRLIAAQRRTALASWLAATVSPTVAAILRKESVLTSAERSFIRLSGHQVEDAADAAAAEGNIHLAMLISQAGGDAEFRSDVENQLAIWSKEGTDKLINESYRKCMAVLAGVTSVWRPLSNGSGEINVVSGLDWKRAFGLSLWYGPDSENMEGFESALDHFERNIGRDGTPFPTLPYQKSSLSKTTPSSTMSSLELQTVALDEADGSFELLRLAAGKIPLERAIYPRGFTSSRLDYRMTWHMYILLSRVMRLKDFSDRQRVESESTGEEEEEPEVEGHSDIADNATCAYAAQLEALGQLQKAVFVLLHLEGSNGRKKAIQDLLCRQAHSLEDWQIIGLQSMSIPDTWIEHALACLAQYEGRTFDAYEHFLKADEQDMAHDIAVYDLAPEAVIRGDMALLRALFHPFDPQAVDDWSFRGKLFLDYADVVERLPMLLAAVEDDAVQDASEATELSRLKNLVPQLIRMVPDVLRDRTDPRHRSALSEMMNKLLSSFDNIRENTNEQLDFDSDLVDEANRLRHIHNTAYNRFLQAVSAVA